MIYLLLGKDDFTKKEFIDDLFAKGSFEMQVLSVDSSASDVAREYFSSDLFGGKRLLFGEGLLGRTEFAEEFFAALGKEGGKTENVLVFLESALDKRKKETKAILANKSLKVVEFEILFGDDLKKWVSTRAKSAGLSFERGVLDLFLARLGACDLWQATSEINKLKTFAGDSEVSAAAVADLVAENIEEDVFAITNAIGDKNRPLAVSLLTNYFDRLPGTDEKTKVISLSALLSDQFRNILILKGLSEEGRSESAIVKEMEFTPGRVFIYKKLASRFSEDKLLDALRKFELLDMEVKTTSGPAALQLFMIVESVIK